MTHNESTEQWIRVTPLQLNQIWTAGWTARFHHDRKIADKSREDAIKEILESGEYDESQILRPSNAATQQREGEIRAEAFKAGAASAYYCCNGIGEFDSAKHKADESAYLEQFKQKEK